MFLNDFFWIEDSTSEKEVVVFKIRINPQHQLLEGHFPGMPVVPGVVMLQMISECLEHHLDCKLILAAYSNIKFLTPLIPKDGDLIDLRISWQESETNFEVNATLSCGSLIFLKLIKGVFTRDDGSKLSPTAVS